MVRDGAVALFKGACGGWAFERPRRRRELLLRRLPNDIKPPTVSTIHAVLDRDGLVCHQGRPRRRAQATPLSAGAAPNDLWCADFKGEFRLDNGVPFAGPNALFNLSKLAAWWLRLGIAIECIKPGHPQQNGRHERMHRPHDALHMQRPADRYLPSARPYAGLPEHSYPLHDKQYMITACGRVCMLRKKINISPVLAGQLVGLTEVEDGIWLVSFMH